MVLWFIRDILKVVNLQYMQLIGMESSKVYLKSSCVKRVPFVNRRQTKGVSFL